MRGHPNGAASEQSIEEKSAPIPAISERRVVALDGLRGLMTIAVVISHYFGELPHGYSVVMVGWIAVDMFFVLSGYLIGSLILEKMSRANFLLVFYLRRACRTLPAYFLCVLTVYFAMTTFVPRAWVDAEVWFPLWSYLTFTQNFFMIATNDIGPHWLVPTWTLALEEQFYLVVPALFALVPRRHLLSALTACALGAVLVRSVLSGSGSGPMAAFVLLPSRADVLLAGVVLAVLLKTVDIGWPVHHKTFRLVPLLALLVDVMLAACDSAIGANLFEVFGPFVTSVGCAAFILMLVCGVPEARRFHSPLLRFFGRISYSTYLMHLPVLGLMHGLILGATPDAATLPQVAVSVLALPITVLAGWVLTKLVEEPITAYGRSWKWSDTLVPQRA
jgi:peptidoglycan/LPS O-acetylase OafA/YrhL